MKVRVGLLGLMAGSAVMLATTGAKADGYVRDRVYSAPITWTGFYIGGHAGYAWSQVDWSNISLTAERVNNDSAGFIGGGQLGYNVQFGNIVVGAEASLSGADLRGDTHGVVNPAAVTYTTRIDGIGTVTGRLGFAADRFLIYAKGGWASAGVNLSGRQSAIPDAFSIDRRRSGWTVGGGVEYLHTRAISVGVEYSYIDLGSASYAGTTFAALPYTLTNADVQVHSVTARLNFHFYPDGPAPLK